MRNMNHQRAHLIPNKDLSPYFTIISRSSRDKNSTRFYRGKFLRKRFYVILRSWDDSCRRHCYTMTFRMNGIYFKSETHYTYLKDEAVIFNVLANRHFRRKHVDER